MDKSSEEKRIRIQRAAIYQIKNLHQYAVIKLPFQFLQAGFGAVLSIILNFDASATTVPANFSPV